MNEKTPIAFMSYVHSDDKYKHLTTFCERLSDEVQVQTGSEFLIFQDRRDIQWGQNWRQRIENSLGEITFLIPIITPGFFNSVPCREELGSFVEWERKLDRNDLILPVYYVDTPLLNDAELRATDPLAEVIASRQYADWRELRFEPFTNPLVGKTLAQLAVQIRNALPAVHKMNKTTATTSAVLNPQTAAPIKGEGGAQPTKSPTAKREPPTRIVDPMYWGDFATITEAIENVSPGTRILVRPGLYQEGLIMDKPLEIIGDGELSEIVIQVAGKDVISFQTTMGRVVNVTLRQMGEGKWYGVDIAQGRLELEDCDITSESLAGVGIHSGADPRLRRNRIHDSKKGGGVVVYGNAQGTLEDNQIFGNASSGVEIETSANTTLRRNRIYDNKEDGVYVHDGGKGTIEDNDIFGNAYSGLTIQSDSNPVVRNNRINQNSEHGIEIFENAGGTFENNDLSGNAKGAWSLAEDSKAKVTRSNNKE
jgi:parallel beta-helix repeat protein